MTTIHSFRQVYADSNATLDIVVTSFAATPVRQMEPVHWSNPRCSPTLLRKPLLLFECDGYKAVVKEWNGHTWGHRGGAMTNGPLGATFIGGTIWVECRRCKHVTLTALDTMP